jgi:ornithine carbamoyltransferase
MRHFLDLFGISLKEMRDLLRETARHKACHRHGERPPVLLDRVLGLVFDKPSLRTRVSFQSAMSQLGGTSIFLTGQEAGLGSRESVADCARVISRYVDAIVLRTFSHETIDTFAAHSSCPVINGLSNRDHPCQALADVFTMHEVFGDLTGRKLVFVGDGNNVARSLAVACFRLGMGFTLVAPDGYGFDSEFEQAYRQHLGAACPPASPEPRAAVAAADVIYTDVWASMGQEAERDSRMRRFMPYQVNANFIAMAPRHARVMHCLPARRGEEITDEVIDGERSIVFQQAENRMHAQKALLEWLLLRQPGGSRP